jgi:hypothetical protein
MAAGLNNPIVDSAIPVVGDTAPFWVLGAMVLRHEYAVL